MIDETARTSDAPQVEPLPAEVGPLQPQTSEWQRRILLLVIAGALLVAAVLLFPWAASAYHLERAGRMLAKDDPSEATYQAAEHALHQALDRDPSNAQAYWLLARAHRQQGDLPAAVDALALFVALKPKDRLALLRLAETCELLTTAEMALVSNQTCGSDEQTREAKLIDLWQSAGQSVADLLPAADRFREQENWAEASTFYSRALLLDVESAEAWYGLANVHQAQGRTQEALDAYARVVTLSSDAGLVASAHASRGKILADSHHWAEASAEMAQAVAAAPDRGSYHLDYGWYLYQAGDSLQNARYELTKAASLVPKNPWPHIHLANLSFAEENLQQSLEHGQRAVELAPDLFWAWVWQGKALEHLNRSVEAEESLRQAIDLAPDEATPYAELGKLLEKVGRLEEAIVQYEKAALLAPGYLWHNLSLAQAYRSNGQASEAREMYRRVLELDPGNAAAERALDELGQ